MAAAEAYNAFVEAEEVETVRGAFAALCAAAQVDPAADGLRVYEQLQAWAESAGLPFKAKRLFTLLDAAVAARRVVVDEVESADAVRAAGAGAGAVLISGAGPVGLRAAVESALLGARVTVVEKRETFSRVNILMFWQQTMDGMVSLGAKIFYPKLRTHGTPLHMGTREIQLCLLKTALMLGVRVHYGTTLAGIGVDTRATRAWSAVLDGGNGSDASATRRASKARSISKRLSGAVVSALSFKPKKDDDYQVTFKCNLVDAPDVDSVFLAHGTVRPQRVPFDALVLAEGEWSQTCRKLGFKKTVDRFSRAIGLVMNLEYDETDAAQERLQSVTLGFSPVSSKIRDRLGEAGIVIENFEYLKGHTHYIVVTFYKAASLLAHGALRRDDKGVDLLNPANVDMAKLQDVARCIADAVGLPHTAPFCTRNGIQLFDFSSRARAYRAARVLTVDGATGAPAVLEDTDAAAGADDRNVLVMPAGDALLEPFWPQGLGSNRGFHGALDAAYAALRARRCGVEDALRERAFAYDVMNCFTWARPDMVLQPHSAWTADPVCRYSQQLVTTTKDLWQAKGLPVPERVLGIAADRGQNAWMR